jgi:hypothetical protein
MRNLLAVWILVVFSSLAVTAQSDTTWTKTFGGDCDDIGYSVQQTTDGGYIIAGYTKSYGSGSSDIWLIKTDKDGHRVWDKTFGGMEDDEGSSVQQTTDGGYIIAGYTKSYGSGSSDIWLIKTDRYGHKVWDKTFGGIEDDEGSSVRQTTDGGYIVTGYSESYGAGGKDVWLIKTHSTGDTSWTRTFGGDKDDKGSSVRPTTDGGYVVAGHTCSFGTSSDDVYLIKTDPQGDTLWTKTFGRALSDYGYSVQQTTDGGFIVAGASNDPYGLQQALLLLIRTDSKGATTWMRTIGPAMVYSYGFSVQQTTDGGYIAVGCIWYYKKEYRYPPPPGPLLIVKTDTLGHKLWERHFQRPDYCANGYSIQQIQDAGYIIIGRIALWMTSGSSDVWLIKTDSLGYVGVEEKKFPDHTGQIPELTVYPNPFLSSTRVVNTEGKIRIYDGTGRLIETAETSVIGRDLEPGIYFLKAERHKTTKIIKVR